MTKFYFIRHGKTQWNLEGRYQGAHGDSPLLDESYRDIKYLGEYLNNITFKKIYASPLLRAQVTAKELDKELGQNIPIVICDDLREFDLGIMEGEKFLDVERKYPELIWAFRNSPADYNEDIIDGESFQTVIKRTNNLISKISMNSHIDDNYLIVSHGAALVTMIQSLLGVPTKDIRKDGGLSNTSVTILETVNKGESFKLLSWNDTEFLKRKEDSTDTI